MSVLARGGRLALVLITDDARGRATMAHSRWWIKKPLVLLDTPMPRRRLIIFSSARFVSFRSLSILQLSFWTLAFAWGEWGEYSFMIATVASNGGLISQQEYDAVSSRAARSYSRALAVLGTRRRIPRPFLTLLRAW